MTQRLAIVASHVIQYQDPFFRLLAREPDIDLEVLYCSPAGAETYRDEAMNATLKWDLELLQGYRYRFISNWSHRADGFMRQINPGLFAAIGRGRYDAVLFMLGWGTLSAWIGFAACRLFRSPILLFGDSSFLPEETTSRQQVRAGIMRSLFRLTTAFMISGRWNADYYEHYGADPRRFFPLPWAIDNDRFDEASRLAPDERSEIRNRLGIRPEAMVVAYSGKLIERKDPLTLLRAFEKMRHRDKAALLFIGDGELRASVEAYVGEHRLRDVVITGFVNQTEIPKLYGISDAFCLPSSFDPRATVVNEAMASGLPVLITDRCGPAGDIAREGENAFIFPFGDVSTLSSRLDLLASDPALAKRMGERSRDIIATWTYEAGIEGVKAALRFVALEGAP